jgi:hypothetical protein
MKFILLFILAIISFSTFAETASSDCTFRYKYKASATLEESLSRNGKNIVVRLNALVQNEGQEFPFNKIILLKNLDGTIASFQNDYSSQETKDQTVIYSVNPTNEKFKAEVTLDLDNKTIKSVKIYQKIYNGVADLILPLHVNRLNCEF